MSLEEAAQGLLDRLDKFINRRFDDDGPDWEYTKLDNAIQQLRDALRGEQ